MKQLLKIPEVYILAAIVALLIGVMTLTDRPQREDPPMVDDWATSEAVDHPGTRAMLESMDKLGLPHNSSRVVDPSLPDDQLTPGAYWKEITLKQISQSGYSATVRNVSDSEKKAVFDRYSWRGISWSDRAKYEVDHLVPLSWGGSNAIENLWPQPYADEWNARVKDRLEVHGLKMIRAGKLNLREAQKKITTDWIAFYQEVFGSAAEPREEVIEDSEQ